MAALTANADITIKKGEMLALPALNDTEFFQGALITVDANGFAIPAAATANTFFAGICVEYLDTTGDDDGDQDVYVRPADGQTLALLTHATGDAAQADVGEKMYVADSSSVDDAAALDPQVLVGTIVAVESVTQVWVRLEGWTVGAAD